MKTILGNKIKLTLEQRLDVVTRIENMIREAGLTHQLIRVDWDTELDFPSVEPLHIIEQLPPAIKLKYMKLINRIIEVSL